MRKLSTGIAGAVLLLFGAAAGAQAPFQGVDDVGVPYLIPPSVVKLDEEQRKKITAIRRELHGRYCELSARLIGVQETLRALLVQEPRPAADAAADASQRITELREEMIAARGIAADRAEALLTAAQRVTLAKWRDGRRGKGEEVEDIPYQVLPGIESDEPDIENLEDPTLDPGY